MSETPRKQMMAEIVKRVRSAVSDLHGAKLHAAHELHWARHVVNWKLTDYKNWTNFCKKEIPMSDQSIWKYITISSLLKKFNYTDAEALKMLNAVGWMRFGIGLSLLKQRIKPESFIDRYKEIDYPGSKSAKSRDPFGDRAYSFSLPKEVADKLDGYLIHYGMVTSPRGNRRGVRDAMISLVEIQLD